ncbi:hypothetical protein DER46DRAFT_611016 [Fusarium sp. MPI-SDFR-AT-0072]|nr:hypothetical protein DER46DRAFT_611016 [Fusarium sp. MPI-SDFR-AT-0072]
MDEHDDRAIALSMAQAVEADAELIAALIREDEQAKRDFEFAMQLDEDSDATPETDDDVIHGGLDEETYRTLHAFNVVVQPTENTEVEMELGSEENHDAMSGGEEDETDDENNPDEDLKGDADNQSDYIASQEDVSQMDEDEIQAEEIQPEETQTEETQGERDADEHPGTAQVTSPAPSELHVETKECLYCSDELPKDEVYEAPCSHGMCQPCLIRSIQTAMKDESIFPPKCCGQAIPVDNTNAFITEDLLTEYDNKREEFETTNRTYCSDKTCSAFIPTRFIEAGIAQCTRCEGRTCLNCLSESHEGTCTDDPESQRVIRLAEEKGWRRCEQCKNMVELEHGCFHICKRIKHSLINLLFRASSDHCFDIACRCDYQFCYLCGKQWKTCNCPQWNEEHLMARAPAPAAAQLAQPVQPVQCRHRDYTRFDRVRCQEACDDCEEWTRRYIMCCPDCNLEICLPCLLARRHQL